MNKSFVLCRIRYFEPYFDNFTKALKSIGFSSNELNMIQLTIIVKSNEKLCGSLYLH